MDFISLGIIYAVIFSCLIFFVYPIELARFNSLAELITRALGSAFFFGVVSGFFSGFIGSSWVNRLEFHSPISIGLVTGIISVITGSLFFPLIGAIIRILYFGVNPAEYIVEISLLVNYSMLGVGPGIFVASITGILGGMAAPDIHKFSTT